MSGDGLRCLDWRKSQRSMSGGACVEVAATNGGVAIRDSKDTDGEVLRYSVNSWRFFIADARNGRFDVQGQLFCRVVGDRGLPDRWVVSGPCWRP